MDSILSKKDVTAVKFFKNYILAGIGSILNVFEKETGRLLQRSPGLIASNIHGLVESLCGKRLLVFGNKQFAVLNLIEVNGKVYEHTDEIVTCEDWIQCALWISDKVVALLTSHNSVVYTNLDTEEVTSNACADCSLLYSGLLLPVAGRLIAMAGTVFSEVIIRWSDNAKIVHRLTGHRGVIFSISCDPHKGIIVSTSDDRSVRIWNMINPLDHSPDSIEFWENITIECKAEVYGHTARVMRNVIVNDLVISGGEDSSICYWRDGQLVRKVPAHQTASIWAMDSDGVHLVTGGGDGAVILHPLTVASDYGDKQALKIDGTIKTVNFTSRKNIVLLNANSDLIYYDVPTKSKVVFKLNHGSTYKMMAVSDCKQLIAVADMFGKLNVYAEPCRDSECIQNIVDIKLDIGKIRSMHFAGNRHLVFCAEEGNISVLTASGNVISTYANFVLPPCKERWLTACARDPESDMIVVADRCSGVHYFSKGSCHPIRTFQRVHGRYGSTSLTIRYNTLISTGRDGTIKYFAIDRENLKCSKYLSSQEFDFNWVEMFLDKNLDLLCGFQESTFIVHNMKTNSKIIQMVCGGGHRPYDVVRHFRKVDEHYEEVVQLVYVKSSSVYLVDFHLNLIESQIILSGSHSKAINSLAVFIVNNLPMSFYVSGGEDTTLRISAVDKRFDLEDKYIFKHLSNVKTVKVIPFGDEFLLFSAGGRAQISVNKIQVSCSKETAPKIRSDLLETFWFKGSDEERRRNKLVSSQEVDSDPEMRIMDLDLINYGALKYFAFVACSDGVLRVFNFHIKPNGTGQFDVIKSLTTPNAGCILKVVCVELFANIHVLITSMTTGLILVWNVVNNEKGIDITLPFSDKPHKAGVNCLDYKVLGDEWLLLATGGDDNRIAVTLLRLRGRDQTNSVQMKSQWISDEYHSSQVTGLMFLGVNLLLSASIDQRVTVLRWSITKSIVKCSYVHQICSDIADIQGMVLLEYKPWDPARGLPERMAVCLYGRGLEVRAVRLPLPPAAAASASAPPAAAAPASAPPAPH